MSKRRKKSKAFWAFIIIVTLGTVLAVWAFVIEPNLVIVHRATVIVPNWNKELNGMKVAVLADLHVGAPYIDIEKLEQIVDKANDLKPDVVVILGDLVIHGVVGGHFVEPEKISAKLGKLTSPLGTIAVLGNHDWWYGGEHVTRTLVKNNITVLENEAMRLTWQDRPFWLAGIADLWTREPNIAGTLQQVATGEPVIFLTHNPDIFPDVPADVSLTLAGHTHGGQVNIPVIGRPIVPSEYGQRYAAGHVVEEGRHLFVGTGVGTSILPVRFRVVPEILMLTIYSQ